MTDDTALHPPHSTSCTTPGCPHGHGQVTEGMTPISTKVSMFDEHGKLVPLDEIEKQVVCFHLAHSGNNAADAAKTLGIGRSTIYRKMEQLGIEPPNGKRPK